jgi:diguanylate cyclase (GGDEF)-like protein
MAPSPWSTSSPGTGSDAVNPLRRRRPRFREPRVGEPIDSIASHLQRLVLRLALAGFLAGLLFVATLPGPVAGEVGLALANMAVVVVTSWRFRPLGRTAVVLLTAAAWTATRWDPWSPAGLVDVPWREGALGLGVLATLAIGVSSFRQAIERLLKTEDALAATLVRERDSARRDRLTRLWNGRYFHDALEHEIDRCRRYGRPFGLLCLDLDGFKAVNDTAGHQAGDLVLQVVGRVLHENSRASDIPARLGGDEFAVILPEASSLTVRRSAAKLVGLIATGDFPPGLPRVTVSVGGVAFTRAPESGTAALRVADEALYAAKREGKNRFVVPTVERVG